MPPQNIVCDFTNYINYNIGTVKIKINKNYNTITFCNRVHKFILSNYK